MNIFNKILGKPGFRLQVSNSINLSTMIHTITAKTEGFSGREISKLVVNFQAKALSSEDGTLTQNMVEQALKDAISSHEEKHKWLSQNEKSPASLEESNIKNLKAGLKQGSR